MATTTTGRLISSKFSYSISSLFGYNRRISATTHLHAKLLEHATNCLLFNELELLL
jgi:hypothetical protein